MCRCCTKWHLLQELKNLQYWIYCRIWKKASVILNLAKMFREMICKFLLTHQPSKWHNLLRESGVEFSSWISWDSVCRHQLLTFTHMLTQSWYQAVCEVCVAFTIWTRITLSPTQELNLIKVYWSCRFSAGQPTYTNTYRGDVVVSITKKEEICNN